MALSNFAFAITFVTAIAGCLLVILDIAIKPRHVRKRDGLLICGHAASLSRQTQAQVFSR
jgi:hypothetical protein